MKLLTQKEVAEILRLSTSTISSLSKENKIPGAIKFRNRIWRYDAEIINDIAKGKIQLGE